MGGLQVGVGACTGRGGGGSRPASVGSPARCAGAGRPVGRGASRRCSRPGGAPGRGPPRPGAGRRCSSRARSAGRRPRAKRSRRGDDPAAGRVRVRPTGLSSPAGPEPVPVGAGRLQPVDLDVHGVGLGGLGEDGAAAHDPPRSAGSAATCQSTGTARAGIPPSAQQRLGCQPGPQHHPAGRRVAGGDPERERVPAPLHRGRRDAAQPVGNQQGDAAPPTASKRRRSSTGVLAGIAADCPAPRHAPSPSSPTHTDRDPLA